MARWEGREDPGTAVGEQAMDPGAKASRGQGKKKGVVERIS